MKDSRWLEHLYLLLLAVGVGLVLLTSTALPGTYNFYFNNAEQGDNSTASPTVMVGKTQPGQPQVAGNENAELSSTATGLNVPALGVPEVREHKVSSTLANEVRPFRVTGTYGVVYRDVDFELGGLAATYFLTDWLGLTGFVGIGAHTESGMEAELVLLNIPLRRSTTSLAVAGLVGALTSDDEANWMGGIVPVHLGGRIELGFGPEFAVTGTFRTKIAGWSGYDALEAGLSYRF